MMPTCSPGTFSRIGFKTKIAVRTWAIGLLPGELIGQDDFVRRAFRLGQEEIGDGRMLVQRQAFPGVLEPFFRYRFLRCRGRMEDLSSGGQDTVVHGHQGREIIDGQAELALQPGRQLHHRQAVHGQIVGQPVFAAHLLPSQLS